MISETLISKGKNNFDDYVFSSLEWSAPTMVSPEEIRRRLNSFKLIGRKITRLRFIGLSYFHTRDWIEDSAYNALPDDMSEEERQFKSDYNNINPALELPRCSEIDEPFLICFENGATFEIDAPQEPEFRFSLNCIPWNIDSGCNGPNLDANIFFAPCIGKRIVDVEVNTYFSDKDPMYGCLIDDSGEKHEMVSRIVLWLEGDIALSISSCIDFCEIKCIDRNNDILPIAFEELKPALFNWEDLHIDETVGYEAESSSFYFGDTGAFHVGSPCITLEPDGTETSLHIEEDDFNFWAWCITNFLHERFCEFDDYEFSYAQWNGILDEADKILSFESFDSLFDYMVSASKYGLRFMNCEGTEFWKNKDKYQKQYEDMKNWSELTMKSGVKMNVYGF